MNPIAGKMDSGNICGIDNKSSFLEHCSSSDMDNIRTILCNRKASLRNSAKLKSQIHSHINDLIETLKERERQLFLEIDEHDIDCVLLMTDKNYVDILSEEKTHPSIDEEHPKVPPSAFLQQKFKFVGNLEPLKTKLQQFGQIEEVKEATNESCGCLPDPTQVKKSRFAFNELMRKLSRKNRTRKAQKESTGSVEPFEVIDGLDPDEYQKYIESLQDDDIEVVSNPDEFQSWQPSFPIHEIGYSNGPKPKDLISPVHNASQDEPSFSGYQAPMQSPDIEKTADPVMQIHEQLRGLLLSSCDEKCQEAKVQTSQLDEPFSNLNDQSFPLELKVKSDGLSPLSPKTPTPSAIIQETFNKYLDQGGSEKWLASTDNELHSKFSYGLNSFVSHQKGLHFNTTR